jgi:hypothetical protein
MTDLEITQRLITQDQLARIRDDVCLMLKQLEDTIDKFKYFAGKHELLPLMQLLQDQLTTIREETASRMSMLTNESDIPF